MICSNCGKANENENNFCKNCGHDLKLLETDPDRTIFHTPFPATSNIDRGYLILAILILINVCIWIAGPFLSRSISNDDGRTWFTTLRVIGIFFALAQFIVMFIFAKRQSYKIAIGIIGAVVILYNIYSLIISFSFSRY